MKVSRGTITSSDIRRELEKGPEPYCGRKACVRALKAEFGLDDPGMGYPAPQTRLELWQAMQRAATRNTDGTYDAVEEVRRGCYICIYRTYRNVHKRVYGSFPDEDVGNDFSNAMPAPKEVRVAYGSSSSKAKPASPPKTQSDETAFAADYDLAYKYLDRLLSAVFYFVSLYDLQAIAMRFATRRRQFDPFKKLEWKVYVPAGFRNMTDKTHPPFIFKGNALGDDAVYIWAEIGNTVVINGSRLVKSRVEQHPDQRVTFAVLDGTPFLTKPRFSEQDLLESGVLPDEDDREFLVENLEAAKGATLAIILKKNGKVDGMSFISSKEVVFDPNPILARRFENREADVSIFVTSTGYRTRGIWKPTGDEIVGRLVSYDIGNVRHFVIAIYPSQRPKSPPRPQTPDDSEDSDEVEELLETFRYAFGDDHPWRPYLLEYFSGIGRTDDYTLAVPSAGFLQRAIGRVIDPDKFVPGSQVANSIVACSILYATDDNNFSTTDGAEYAHDLKKKTIDGIRIIREFIYSGIKFVELAGMLSTPELSDKIRKR